MTTGRGDAGRHRTIAMLVGGAAWLVYVATAGGTLATSDAVAMFAQADAMVTRGAMDVSLRDSSEEWRGTNGRFYLPFGVAQPIYDIPFLLAGRAAAAITGTHAGGPDALPKAAVAMASTIPAAAAVAFGFLLAWRLSSDLGASLVMACALAFGTLLWPYAKFGFNAALAAGALTGGVYGIGVGGIMGRPRLLAAGSAGLAIAWLTRHEMALAAVVSLLWLAWCTRHRPDRARLMLAASVGVVIAAGVWMTLNFVHFGHPLWTGHRPDVSFAGVMAFLVSPSGALVLFSPVVIAQLASLPLLKRGDALAWLMAGVTLVMTAFYASLDDWLGTRSYGPRYLVPMLPLMVAPLALWWTRARHHSARFLLMGLIAVSVLVQWPAVVVDFSRPGLAEAQPPQKIRRDDWGWSPIWLNTRAAAEAIPANLRYVTGQVPPPTPASAEASSLSDRLSFSLDFWWLYLYYLGAIPRWAAIAASLVPLAGAAALAFAAYGRTRS